MTKNFNEVLRAMEEKERRVKDAETAEDYVMELSDTQRIKVLSPGRLVAKRFFRNKLAILGSVILIIMFIFSFFIPLLYPYGQTEIFYKYDSLVVNYAQANERTDYQSYVVDENIDVHFTIRNRMTSYITEMETTGLKDLPVSGSDGSSYIIRKLGESVYSLDSGAEIEVAHFSGMTEVSSYNTRIKAFLHVSPVGEEFEASFLSAIESNAESFEADGEKYNVVSVAKNAYSALQLSTGKMIFPGTDPGSGFTDAFLEGIETNSFEYNDISYKISYDEDGYRITFSGEASTVLVFSLFVFDAFESGSSIREDYKPLALLSMYTDGEFELDGDSFSVEKRDDGYVVLRGESPVASLSTFVVRRYTGGDTLSMDFKKATEKAILEAEESGQKTAVFSFPLPRMDMDGNFLVDEKGELTAVDTEITATFKVGTWELTCEQITHLIDIYAPPSREHIFGTDADGFDILARMMYGGRVSLMVGFVVVILEVILGVIMGGIAGYFAGWVDTVIMRLVDVFYCIPTYPILIILGAFFDGVKMGSYMRLIWMMVVMGILGWAPVARLVRGQILSLREQEFMTAAESTGISSRRKIFRHLIPNVMPQLIVSATMGLGSVIIMESTLSFLGLGVKHPLATWGTMINSITSSNENLIRYAYIWIPVGLLICLTVIAFNFVGDGLRDAFDPKMKQ